MDLIWHRLQKLRYLRSCSISSNLILAHDVNAWGARGPEFKSRRSDQFVHFGLLAEPAVCSGRHSDQLPDFNGRAHVRIIVGALRV